MESEEEPFHIDEPPRNVTNDLTHEDDTPSSQILFAVMKIALLSIGFLANIIIIYTIARTTRLHTKLHYLIMNIAITGCVLLLVETDTFWMSLSYGLSAIQTQLEHNGLNPPILRYYMCILAYCNTGIQLNMCLFLFLLASNMVINNSSHQIKRILCGMYGFIVFTLIVNVITCAYSYRIPLTQIGSFFVSLFFIVYVVIRDCNSCYKKRVQKDPVCEETQFRLDIARIYCYNWLIPKTLLYHYFGLDYPNVLFMFCKLPGHITSVWILVYLIRCDRLFAESFRNAMRCKQNADDNNDTGDCAS